MPDNTGRPSGEPEGASQRRGGDSVAKTRIRDEVVAFHVAGVGNVAAVLPVIPEGAPYKIREGIARRRVATLTGTCPCGAKVDYAAAVRDRAKLLRVEHERSCPADDRRLKIALRRWLR